MECASPLHRCLLRYCFGLIHYSLPAMEVSSVSDLQSEADREEFRGLCADIGFIVIHWALIEQQMDNWVRAAFANAEGRALSGSAGIPRSLSKKAKFLKSCFLNIPTLQPLREDGRSLVTRIEEVAKNRHYLVHGAIISMSPSNGNFQFRIMEYDAEHIQISRFEINANEFDQFKKILENIFTDALSVSQRLGRLTGSV